MKASITNVRISPKKANLVAGLIRGKKATEALAQLKFTPKKGADILFKLITSAVANATVKKQKKESLFIKALIVNKGVTYKRGIAVSRGRYHPLKKRNSNISVEMGILTDTSASEGKEEKATKAKAEPEKTEKAEKKPAKKAEKAEKTTTKAEAPQTADKKESAAKQEDSK